MLLAPARGIPNQTHADNILALAKRIANSPARFVMLAEGHRQTYMQELVFSDDACAQLVEGDFTDICAEEDADSNAIMDRDNSRTQGHAFVYALNNMPTKELRPQMIDDYLGTTAKEVLQASRSRLNRSELLLESFYVKPATKLNNAGGRLYHFSHLAIEASYMSEPAQRDELFNIISDYNDRKTLDGFARQHGGMENLKTKILEEFQVLSETLKHQRIYGGNDAAAAKKVMKADPKRAAIHYGAEHLLLDNNPASLPDQLAPHGEVEVILVISPPYSPKAFAELMQNLHKEKGLRPSAIAYDLELQREWPILEWLQNAPKIYGYEVETPAAAPKLG